jgi:serine/threonine protein kinase
VIDLDNLSENDAELLHGFFRYHEQNSHITEFNKQNIYQLPDKTHIKFKTSLIRYEKNKKHEDDRAEYIYTNVSDQSLGSGGGGYVNRAAGKLVHSEDRMIYIKPTDIKAEYDVNATLVNDIKSINIDELKKLTQGKIPILMKDKITGEVAIFGRKNNRWMLTPLDKNIFASVTFTNTPSLLSNIDLNIFKEMHKGHTRNPKAFKTIIINPREDIERQNIEKQNIARESEIGRATGNAGTKKATFVESAKIKKGMIVMDVLPGQSLDKIIESKKLTAAQRLDLSINLLKALQKYHDDGYVHRDIKPGNIMIDVEHGMAVHILDHGISRKIDAPDGKQVLTPLYVSPEMMGAPDKAGIESDVYSMGRVLKELWGESEMLAEGSIPGQYAVPFKRNEEFLNSPAPTDLKLDETISHEPIRSKLSHILVQMNTVSTKDRMKIKEGISELTSIKQANLSIDPILNLLGDGRKGNVAIEKSTNQFNAGIFQNFITQVQHIQPHLMIRMFQDIFKYIQENKNNLYSNIGAVKKTYTNTQLMHLQVLKDAYLDYLSKLNLKAIPKEDLKLLQDQLKLDQDMIKNPKNINNFNMNKTSRAIGAETDTHKQSDGIIKNIAHEMTIPRRAAASIPVPKEEQINTPKPGRAPIPVPEEPENVNKFSRR